MRSTATLVLGLLLGLATHVWGEEPPAPEFQFPAIEGFGGVVAVPDGAEAPRRGAKVVFDLTADSPVDQPHKGLETVARYLNLHAQAGLPADEVRLALVLHGGATQAALSDAAYARRTGATANPNLPLIRLLRKAGVEVFVCGQSLARNRLPTGDVDRDVTIAVSAMTVNINKQLDGYAYLSLR